MTVLCFRTSVLLPRVIRRSNVYRVDENGYNRHITWCYDGPLSGVVLVLWTRVTVKVSQMDVIGESPIPVKEIGLQSIGNAD